MLRLPPLNALRAFEAAARHVSFKAAADELFVTQGAISRHILKLEEALGVKLFLRLHRQVELTREGARYLREVRDAFLQISRATANLSSAPDERMLRIKLPPTCAIRWLVPRLGRFHALHPDIAVQVTTSHDPVVFERDEVDVAVAYGEGIDRKLAGDRLFGEVLIPVCSRKLLGRGRRLRQPRDVSRYVLLHSIRRPTDWSQWFAAAGIADLTAQKELTFENSAMTYQGAVDGLGIALAQAAFISDELSSGRLVNPIDIKVQNRVAYFLVFPRERQTHAKIRAFHAWIAEEASFTRRTNPLL
ncbi:MAG: transcriptional regulator GcvA [Proteobacteria bacterium]|nr:transcriptional regulator GcvA [Pseudomonadota bacterium]MBI3497459.1 transcriptional regulator GcvA [Pseudomonadota bacterium]